MKDEQGQMYSRYRAWSMSEAETEDKLVGLAGHISGSDRRREGKRQVTSNKRHIWESEMHLRMFH